MHANSAVIRSNHKIIITGTGRAGTTFLVQLLTRLGLDTGYTSQPDQRDYFTHCSAGLEHDPESPAAPYIVKNPGLCETLPAILDRGAIVIDHAIVPIRSLDDAASSRIRVGGDGRTPGGLWGTDQSDRQKSVLAERFHGLVHTLAVNEIPHTFLHFPRFARDADYTRRKLHWLVGAIPEAQFLAAFNATARPELIHAFKDAPVENPGEPARDFASRQSEQRWERRGKRFFGASCCTFLIWLVVGWIPASDAAGRLPDPSAAAVVAGPAIPWRFLQRQARLIEQEFGANGSRPRSRPRQPAQASRAG